MSAAAWWGAATVYVVTVVALCVWIYCAAKATDEADDRSDDWDGWL